MTEDTSKPAAPATRRFLIGQSPGGLWIVRDDEGKCGALFKAREDALHFVKSESEASQPQPSEWRFVAALDLRALLTPRRAVRP
jgi:hypothetical protein